MRVPFLLRANHSGSTIPVIRAYTSSKGYVVFCAATGKHV
jgi:hypothetical protein